QLPLHMRRESGCERRDLHVGLNSHGLNSAAFRCIEPRRREANGATARKGDNILHSALSEGPAADKSPAPPGLKCAGNELGARCGSAIDEHDQRSSLEEGADRQWIALEGLDAVPTVQVRDRSTVKKGSGQAHGRVHQTAVISAEIEDETLQLASCPRH